MNNDNNNAGSCPVAHGIGLGTVAHMAALSLAGVGLLAWAHRRQQNETRAALADMDRRMARLSGAAFDMMASHGIGIGQQPAFAAMLGKHGINVPTLAPRPAAQQWAGSLGVLDRYGRLGARG